MSTFPITWESFHSQAHLRLQQNIEKLLFPKFHHPFILFQIILIGLMVYLFIFSLYLFILKLKFKKKYASIVFRERKGVSSLDLSFGGYQLHKLSSQSLQIWDSGWYVELLTQSSMSSRFFFYIRAASSIMLHHHDILFRWAHGNGHQQQYFTPETVQPLQYLTLRSANGVSGTILGTLHMYLRQCF